MQFISELRLWESAQLYSYLHSVVRLLSHWPRTNVRNPTSLPTLKRRQASITLREGLRNLRSCSSNLRYGDELSFDDVLSGLSDLHVSDEKASIKVASAHNDQQRLAQLGIEKMFDARTRVSIERYQRRAANVAVIEYS